MPSQNGFEPFSVVVNEYLLRAGLNASRAAKLIGCDRHTINRWTNLVPKSRPPLPQPHLIQNLIDRLQIPDPETGQLRNLNEHEVARLWSASGRDVSDQVNRVRTGQYFRVHSYSYAFTQFPPKWDERTIQLEQQHIPGKLDLMLDYISEITRHADYYSASKYHKDSYHQSRINAYIDQLEQRRHALERRVQVSTVRHLYSLTGIRSYLSEEPSDPRYSTIPVELRRNQLRLLLEWVNKWRKRFLIGIATQPLPANFEIIGRDTVLLEFDKRFKDIKEFKILGIELHGEVAVQEFTDLFDAVWNHQTTVTDVHEIRGLFPDVWPQ